MIEALFYKIHFTQRDVSLYHTSDLTCPRYKMQQDKNFPVSPAKVWKVAKHVLVNQVRGFEQGSQTKKSFFQEKIFVNFCLSWILLSLSKVKVEGESEIQPCTFCFCFSSVCNSM